MNENDLSGLSIDGKIIFVKNNYINLANRKHKIILDSNNHLIFKNTGNKVNGAYIYLNGDKINSILMIRDGVKAELYRVYIDPDKYKRIY